MNRYEVGYEDEFIGLYLDIDEESAIRQCKSDMIANNFTPDTSPRDRLKGLIANKID